MTVAVVPRMAGMPFTPLGRLRRGLRDPAATQRKLLRRLLHHSADTRWGREHHFRDVLRYVDFLPAYRERVPLCGYEDVRPYIKRARAGEPNVLWPGRTREFGISAGTVSSGEVIPVSRSMLRAMARSSLVPGLQYVRQTGKAAFLGGKLLSVPGGVSEDGGPGGALVGEVSGLMARAVPTVLSRRFQALPLPLMLMEGWESKLRRVAAHTLKQDVRAIIMVPSWAPLLFDAVLAQASRAGRHPTGIREVWPRLQVFFSGGVALRSYRPILERYLDGGVDFIETYSASEGVFAFQDDVDAPDLLLHVDSGVFYEFVRMDQLHEDLPHRCSLAEVTPGVDYAMFVSTCSGLWGYGVQDVVRFTGTTPPRILVVGRTTTILDEYGEALRADEVEQALAVAAHCTNAQYVHAHVTYAPVCAPTPQHEVLVEFLVPPRDRATFEAAFDHYLQEHNRHYRIRREPGVLAAPSVTALPVNTCVRYLRHARGRVSPQTKLLAMSPKRDVATGLLQAAASCRRTEGS